MRNQVFRSEREQTNVGMKLTCIISSWVTQKQKTETNKNQDRNASHKSKHIIEWQSESIVVVDKLGRK